MPFHSLASSFADALPTDVARHRSAQALEAAYQAWCQSTNKSQYMTALDLPMAQALMVRILREAPNTSRSTHRREVLETL